MKIKNLNYETIVKMKNGDIYEIHDCDLKSRSSYILNGIKLPMDPEKSMESQIKKINFRDIEIVLKSYSATNISNTITEGVVPIGLSLFSLFIIAKILKGINDDTDLDEDTLQRLKKELEKIEEEHKED